MPLSLSLKSTYMIASPEQRLKTVNEYIDRMPSLSTTVTKVLEICNKPNTSPHDLNKVISLDPVLTGQVLKLINSAYYSLPNQITSLARAIIMLGINTVKNLALSTAILGTLGKTASPFPMDTFWAHCLCVGVTAKTLAASKKIPPTQQEEYFVAGLLHDLGKLPLHNCFPEEYSQAVALADLEQGPLYRAEETIMTTTHAQAGELIAAKWQFNETIAQCIAFHHTPSRANEETRNMVAIIALANCYANIYEYGFAGDYYPTLPDLEEFLRLTNFSWQDLQHLTVRVEGEIEKAKIFLQVNKM